MGNELGNFFTNKKILITGGGGYLASRLLTFLCDIECQIICIDKPDQHFQKPIGKAAIDILALDIRDGSIWQHVLAGVDIVFHFAAQTSVYKANECPSSDVEINVIPMLRLLETCEKNGLAPIILFSGTVTEAGIPVRLPVDEVHPDNPVTIYDLHKLMAENYLKYFVKRGIVRGTVLRLANVYGPGPPGSSADRGILNLMIRKAIAGQPLTVYGQGNFLRDYIFVDDVAQAFIQAAEHIDATNGQHYVIGSGQGNSIIDAFSLVADRVTKKTSHRVPVVCVEPPENLSSIEMRNFVANSSKFSRDTGWRSRYSFVDGIDHTIEFYLQRWTNQ